MKISLALTVVAATMVLPSLGLQAQTDPMLGKFSLNVAKSKYEPGPAPKSETRTYELFGGDGVKATFNRVDASGKQMTISYSAMYDGKDYAYMGSPDADTITLKRVDPNTVEATLKKNGKVVQTAKAVLSKDGKTRTVTANGTDASGRKISQVTVFERQ